eukprot:TRINITY_DN4773_c0_g2_i1.p1 TRINITY_DN4773_c0_g2~~TRINITY_DN4773_c0_g2_i1.p1  ORF type:complete len:282 (-),score=3.17 TRINITY_DN4773_c0_g2_i1:109-954(-)
MNGVKDNQGLGITNGDEENLLLAGAEANQPANSTNSFPVTDKNLVRANIESFSDKYWIKRVGGSCCERQNTYAIYKGCCPNEEQQIMTCASTTYCERCRDEIDSSVDELEIRSGEVIEATLLCQQRETEEIGQVCMYDRSDITIELDDHFCHLRFYPSTKILVIPVIAYAVLVVGFVVLILLLGTKTALIILLAIFCVLILVMIYLYLRPLCAENHILKSPYSEITDIDNNDLYATVYTLRGLCCGDGKEVEIVCYKELTRPQLLGFISMAILSLRAQKKK